MNGGLERIRYMFTKLYQEVSQRKDKRKLTLPSRKRINLYTMSSLSNSTIEAWLLAETEPSLYSKVRLSGETSLYQRYVDFCQLQGVVPAELRVFSKEIESLIQQHFSVSSPKTRDQRGILYKGIQLKPY